MLQRLRHISTHFLWIQDKVRNNEIDVVKILGNVNPADLLTKNVSAELLRRHTEALGVWINGSRARTAPQLSSAANMRPAAAEKDTWEPQDSEVVRVHRRPRRNLFTPLRVCGAPPAKALTGHRVTTGTFCKTGERFKRTDAWTSRATAHLELGESWAGEIQLFYKSEWSETCGPQP